jgi:hypothetical protein
VEEGLVVEIEELLEGVEAEGSEGHATTDDLAGLVGEIEPRGSEPERGDVANDKTYLLDYE